jgi:hypothetical protein
MSTCRLWILTLGILARFVSVTQAAQLTAQQMFVLCNEPSQSEAAQACNLFMTGFASGAFTVLAANPSKEVCLPDYFNGDDARAVFNRFMKSNGQDQVIATRPVSTVLWFAISLEFVCKK